MDIWNAVHWIRFREFLHVPDDEKRYVCRQLLTLRFDQIHVRTLIGRILQTNRYTDVLKCIRSLQKRSESTIPRHYRNNMDIEAIMNMYWDESHEVYSLHLLKGLLSLTFTMTYNPPTWSPWPTVYRLWTTSKNQEEKEAMLVFLEALQATEDENDTFDLSMDPFRT